MPGSPSTITILLADGKRIEGAGERDDLVCAPDQPVPAAGWPAVACGSRRLLGRIRRNRRGCDPGRSRAACRAGRRSAACAVGAIQARILGQDRHLEIAKGPTRIDTELLAERRASIVDRPQGFRLAPGSIQRQREVGA